VTPPRAYLFSFVVLVAANAALAAGCGGGGSTATGPAASGMTTGDVTSTGESGEALTEGPFVVDGRGPTKRLIDVPADYAPLILAARYPEDSLLTVQIRGTGLQPLKGHRGAFLFDSPPTSATAMRRIASGQYELIVKGTKGPWTLQFSGPNTDVSGPALVGRPIGGKYDIVGNVHLDRESELQWEMQTNGSLFSAELLGFGDAQGTEQQLGVLTQGLALEPGNHGFRSDGVMPAGDYLLIVEADGTWSVSFTATE
jgi:hypothetical protein